MTGRRQLLSARVHPSDRRAAGLGAPVRGAAAGLWVVSLLVGCSATDAAQSTAAPEPDAVAPGPAVGDSEVPPGPAAGDLEVPAAGPGELGRVVYSSTTGVAEATAGAPVERGAAYAVQTACAAADSSTVTYRVEEDGDVISEGGVRCDGDVVTNSVGPLTEGSDVRVALEGTLDEVETAYAVVVPLS